MSVLICPDRDNGRSFVFAKLMTIHRYGTVPQDLFTIGIGIPPKTGVRQFISSHRQFRLGKLVVVSKSRKKIPFQDNSSLSTLFWPLAWNQSTNKRLFPVRESRHPKTYPLLVGQSFPSDCFLHHSSSSSLATNRNSYEQQRHGSETTSKYDGFQRFH